jgi:hypothetical protein
LVYRESVLKNRQSGKFKGEVKNIKLKLIIDGAAKNYLSIDVKDIKITGKDKVLELVV